MKNIKLIPVLLVMFAITALGFSSCQRCKTCKYTNSSGNTPSPEAQYCDDELTQKEQDPNLTCS
jgi:hypothetical protein